MDDILEELIEKDMSSPGWLNRFQTLKHDYEHHMDDEENEVFGRAGVIVDAGKIDGHGAEFEARKKKEMGPVARKKEDHLED